MIKEKAVIFEGYPKNTLKNFSEDFICIFVDAV